MQITQVLVGNTLYPLIEGEPLRINVGDTLRVSYGFRYKMPETSDVGIWASLYKYSFGILDRQGQSQTKEIITLVKALDWEGYSGEIDIVIGNMPVGAYGLILELHGYGDEAEYRIDDCLEIAVTPSIFDAIGPILVLGLMAGIMIPMMKEGNS